MHWVEHQVGQGLVLSQVVVQVQVVVKEWGFDQAACQAKVWVQQGLETDQMLYMCLWQKESYFPGKSHL